MPTILVWAVLIILIAWFFFKHFAPVKGMKTLRSEQFKAELANNKDRLLIDVREPHEFAGRHISGTFNIPLSQFNRRLGELPKNKPILLYCHSGMRSKQGGIMSWKKS